MAQKINNFTCSLATLSKVGSIASQTRERSSSSEGSGSDNPVHSEDERRDEKGNMVGTTSTLDPNVQDSKKDEDSSED